MFIYFTHSSHMFIYFTHHPYLILKFIANIYIISKMGESQSTILKQENLRSEHPAFNNAKIITQLDHKYIQATFLTQNSSYDSWLLEMEKGKTKLKSEHLLLPLKTNYTHNQGLCGNSGSLKIQYPFYPHILSRLIQIRSETREYFLQGQLWYILYVIAAALQEIKPYSTKLGDIKPENIFVDDYGKVKVGNVYSWPDELPSFIKANDQANLLYNSLLAPEDLQSLQRGSLNNELNQLSQIFAIGATIVSAGLLQKCSQIYNFQNKTFSMAAFRSRRKEWAQNVNYSDIFKSLILNLMDKNPGMRLSSAQLWQFLSKYQKDIVSKRKFVIEAVPAKIQLAFGALRSQNY